MNTSPRIAIIGAGPGGLLCARVLQRRGIDVAVYDTDASVDSRNQGGTLDLHADSGQIGLADAGLLEEFRRLARPEGQTKRMRDQHGILVVEHVADPDEDAAPEIDRGQLRRILADAVEPGTVRWGHRLLRAVPLGSGVHRLEFATGETSEVDLVIGADGAWSRVRPLVTEATAGYSGVSFVEVRFDDVETLHPEISTLVGDGHMFANGSGRSIIVQRNSNGRVHGYIGMRTDLDWHRDLDLDDVEMVRAALLNLFDGWSEMLTRVIVESESFVNRPIVILPAPLAWEHTAGVTLLGDAAHVMSPFGGDGVNLALLDGAELARSVAESADIDEAITRYEARMLPRSGPIAVGANEALADFFSDGDWTADDVPDFEAEAARYKENAREYRAKG